MKAHSKNQQQLMAIALKNPKKVSEKNRGVLKMKKSELRKFAETKTTGLPETVNAETKTIGLPETVKPRKRRKKVMPKRKNLK